MKKGLLALLDLVFPVPQVEAVRERLAPPYCERCGRPYATQAQVEFRCDNCEGMAWWLGRGRARYRSCGVVRELVHRFKYERHFWVRQILAGWIEEGYREYYGGERWDALVPVPLHSERLRWREFNQAEQLAGLLGRRVGLRVWPCLERRRATEVQSRLRRVERLKNLRGAFALVKGWNVRDKRLLVIDDVLTTGSTVNACARVLVEAGAARVDALCVARG